jgi:hypothetical protein
LARATSSRPSGPGHSPAAADVAAVVSGNVELMTQKEVLNFKPAPRLEQIADKCSKQDHECGDRSGPPASRSLATADLGQLAASRYRCRRLARQSHMHRPVADWRGCRGQRHSARSVSCPYGPGHKRLQSKAGYIDARPQSRQLDESSLATRGWTIHSGSITTLLAEATRPLMSAKPSVARCAASILPILECSDLPKIQW